MRKVISSSDESNDDRNSKGILIDADPSSNPLTKILSAIDENLSKVSYPHELNSNVVYYYHLVFSSEISIQCEK
ncbi:unnamed protein product [Schistosoma curassoni]|uniref:DUF4806 domain-containing protein n=1 Tax=Schistosoma curassoni TaxID=6186 RepID=A0A183L5Z8_9TREM|nr:unnamed protein product [Schistosoma curassoni]